VVHGNLEDQCARLNVTGSRFVFLPMVKRV
jgi:hypothetical protein